MADLITSLIARQSQAKKTQISCKIWQKILTKSPNDKLVMRNLNLYGGKIKRTFVPHHTMKLEKIRKGVMEQLNNIYYEKDIVENIQKHDQQMIRLVNRRTWKSY